MDDEHDDLETDPLIGAELEDRYRITALLGEGGMGVVYRAEHLLFGTELAIKVLNDAAARHPEALGRLEREAHAASAIGDPHIVDVKDFGWTDAGDPYVVMEYLEGESLADLVHEHGRLPWTRACHIAHQVARGLAAAHAAGVVHRDLKADNLLLVRRGDDPDFPKIFDFGIAKLQGSNAKLTMAGAILGTPQYMSPEQCAGRPVDHRTDIYALGVLLYEMLVGDVPFDSEDLRAVLLAHMQEPVLPPRAIFDDVPEALDAIVLRCLAKDVDARFGSMDEVADALAAVPGFEAAEAGPTPVRVPAPVPPSDPPPVHTLTSSAPALDSTRRPSRRGAAAVLAIAGLGVAALVAGLAFVGGEPVDSENAAEPIESAATAGARLDAEDRSISEPSPSKATRVARSAAPDTELSERTARASATETPTTLLETEPIGATVYEGDERLGTTPLRIDRPSEGERRTLRIEADGHRERQVVIAHLTDDALRVPLAPIRRLPMRRSAAPVRGEIETVSAPSSTEQAAIDEPVRRSASPAADAPADLVRARPFLDPWGDET